MYISIFRAVYLYDKHFDWGLPVIVFDAVMFLFAISNFTMATFTDPGTYPRGTLLYIHFTLYSVITRKQLM